MSRKPSKLPDLDDDEAFRQRLQPLVKNAVPTERKTGVTEHRMSVTPEGRVSVVLDDRIPGGLVEAAQKQARIEAVRGQKRRFEYLIPDRVGRALAEDAAARGQSATTRLLEVLREAGYPVIQEDLIDLRKMPKR